jgi:hypothetical protein
MIRFAFSPGWFSPIDSFFELLALIVLVLISLYAWKCYRTFEIKNYRHLAYAFFSLVAAFIFKIGSNIIILYDRVRVATVGNVDVTVHQIVKSEAFSHIGTTMHYFFFLLGLLMLYTIIYKQTHKPTSILLTFFIIITTLFSYRTFFVFYLTSAFILGFIFVKYWRNYREKKAKNTLLLALAFLVLMISHLVFIFVNIDLQFYVVAEVLQLFGFILMLLAFISIFRK